MTTLAVDAMGGDFGPQVTLPACLNLLKANPNLKILLCGHPDHLKSYNEHASDRLEFVSCNDVVLNDDAPSLAIRQKKDSSLRKIVELVRDGKADACVSSGNTGALMGLSRYILKTHFGIDRPAIVTQIPGMKTSPWMLDLGANVDCTSENLVQFAIMGAAVAEVNGIDSPRIALLNVGEEQNKGNEEVRLAYQQLNELSDLNFTGYIEGEGIFRGEADVVVCDGFVGNVALKITEGLVEYIEYKIQKELKKTWFYRLFGLLVKPIMGKLAKQFEPQERNGAILVGLQGIVVKSHGKANQLGFESALKLAIKEAESNMDAKIASKLEQSL